MYGDPHYVFLYLISGAVTLWVTYLLIRAAVRSGVRSGIRDSLHDPETREAVLGMLATAIGE